MILVIDNYDSFTFNLVQYIGELGAEVAVYRNDKISLDEIERLRPEAIVISPGPCTPSEAGISVDAVKHFAGRIPIFGVCLGHQSIVQAFGGKIVHAPRLMHGKTSRITHDGRSIYRGVSNPFEAGRYHSLVADRETFPSTLQITAETSSGEIMGVRHKYGEFLIEGVQFHPESILTPEGKQIVANFLELASEYNSIRK